MPVKSSKTGALNSTDGSVDNKPPNILMLCLDAVRADHVAGLDGGPSVTPSLEKLASRGVLFTKCFAPAPWTLPSFGTLFTGLYPSEHGADEYQATFSPEAPTLAEKLGDTHETICVSFNPYLTHRFNLTRGFEKTYVFGRYVPRVYSHRTRYAGWRRFSEFAKLLITEGRLLANLSEMTTHLATAWDSRGQVDQGVSRNNQLIRRLFARRGKRPLFILANYMEAHWPYFYARETGWLSPREAAFIRGKVASSFPFGMIRGKVTMSTDDDQLLAALYASAIHYLDRKIGELWEVLAEGGDLDNTYLIVFADHGEMLGELGLYGHTLTLHNRVLHVPLLLVPPHGESHQGVFSKRFRLQDLRELVLRLADDPSDLQTYLEDYPEEQLIYAEYAGRQDRLTAEDRRFLTESSHLTTMSSVLIDGRHKLVRSSRGADRLYDLPVDPDEEVDSAGIEADVAQAMGRKLENFQSRLQRAEDTDQIRRDAAIEERLRALGYH